jgi:hypothetical protein
LKHLERAFAAMCANVEALHARVYELETHRRSTGPARGATMALNLTTRSMALKLSRNGQDARRIAKVLGVGVGEVELLIKVQRLQRGTLGQPRQDGEEARIVSPRGSLAIKKFLK